MKRSEAAYTQFLRPVEKLAERRLHAAYVTLLQTLLRAHISTRIANQMVVGRRQLGDGQGRRAWRRKIPPAIHSELRMVWHSVCLCVGYVG